MRARGVDTSKFQGYADFRALSAAGYDFVIPRMTSGARETDSFFQTNVLGAMDAGLLVPAAYHVITWGSSVDDQVSNALQQIATYDIPAIMIDLEVTDSSISDREKVVRVLDMTKRFKEAGRLVLVYSYKFYELPLEKVPELSGLAAITEYVTAWYPHEKVEPSDRELPYVPPAWGGRWWGWQWSGDGGLVAPGFHSVVDHDVYNGDHADLVNWMRGGKFETEPSTNPEGPTV